MCRAEKEGFINIKNKKTGIIIEFRSDVKYDNAKLEYKNKEVSLFNFKTDYSNQKVSVWGTEKDDNVYIKDSNVHTVHLKEGGDELCIENSSWVNLVSCDKDEHTRRYDTTTVIGYDANNSNPGSDHLVQSERIAITNSENKNSFSDLTLSAENICIDGVTLSNSSITGNEIVLNETTSNGNILTTSSLENAPGTVIYGDNVTSNNDKVTTQELYVDAGAVVNNAKLKTESLVVEHEGLVDNSLVITQKALVNDIGNLGNSAVVTGKKENIETWLEPETKGKYTVLETE